MIAVLATACVLAAARLVAKHQFTTYPISSILTYLANGRLASLPVIVLAALTAIALTAFILRRIVYGGPSNRTR
jgi:predicted ABC-type sugar transport system permease subunit